MGNSTSTAYNSSLSLTNEEKSCIQNHLQRIIKLGNGGLTEGIEEFVKSFDTPLKNSVKNLLDELNKENSQQSYFNKLGAILKGTQSDKLQLLNSLFFDQDLFSVVKALSQKYLTQLELNKSLPLSYLEEWSEFIITYKEHKRLLKEEIEESDFTNFTEKIKSKESDNVKILQENTLLFNFISFTILNILLPEFKFKSFVLPQKIAPSPKASSLLLDKSLVLMLQQFLPEDCTTPFINLYHSKIHGKSWNRFQSAIENQGSTIIIIQDREGNIFGCFNYMDWKLNPKFYGDSKNFLFSLKPKMRVYFATSYNQNYMYLNHSAQTLPNGLGMGGQLEYFGLYLDDKLESGHSMANPFSSTYYNPQLSKSAKFDIDHVEVYQVREPARDEDDTPHNGKSILDTNPDAMAILEMADKPMYSKFVRDPDLDIE